VESGGGEQKGDGETGTGSRRTAQIYLSARRNPSRAPEKGTERVVRRDCGGGGGERLVLMSARRRGVASGTAGAGRKRTKPHQSKPLLNSPLLPLPAPVASAGNEQ
jgi:hypothetical protein